MEINAYQILHKRSTPNSEHMEIMTLWLPLDIIRRYTNKYEGNNNIQLNLLNKQLIHRKLIDCDGRQ